MKAFINYFVVSFLLLTSAASSQIKTESVAIKQSSNYGKSVAVFGGSVAVIPVSDSAKNLWKEYLAMKITNYGVGGAGFSSLQGKSLQ